MYSHILILGKSKVGHSADPNQAGTVEPPYTFEASALNYH